jgi:transposase
MPALIEFPLDLPEVRVLQTELKDREIVITVESTREFAICPHCGCETREFHAYGETIRLRHLPILNRRVFIELRPKRYRCWYCEGGPTTTQQLDWYEPRAPHTKAYERSLMLQLVNSTISDLAIQQGLSYEAVVGALQRQVASHVNWDDFTSLRVIGLDEIALKKGHQHYVVIVTTRQADDHVALLGVLPDRLKETVAAFLRAIPESLRATIEEVCTDMYEGYAGAVKAEVRQARVVIDRFHVAKAYRACADQLRKQKLRELKQALSQAESAFLKGTMWPFRRDPQDLTEEEQQALTLLLEGAPELKKAYDLREELTAIFDTQHTKAPATAAIQGWIARVAKSGLRCFDSFLKTLEHWLDEITNYFIDRRTSGFVEGLNNKIKVLKRRCYGITNVAHLFQRLFLDLEGYRLFAPAP